MKITQVLFSTVVLPVTLLGFIGCKSVKIKDGRVPQQYLSEAKKLEGTYRGQFNGVPGTLTVKFQGSKPVVTYKNSRGTDILNNNCGSRIGNLFKVTMKGTKENPEISKALFAFDPGGCSLMVQGRELALSFKNTKDGMRVKVSLLSDYDNYYGSCRYYGPGYGYPGYGYPYPGYPYYPGCDYWDSYSTYLYGSFTR